MPFAISIIIGGTTVHAELDDCDTTLDIVEKLPMEADFSTWGDEIYFSIPVSVGLQDSKDVVKPGDLGYWPPGNAFCIFYGATPGSTEDEIRPASPVNVIGRVKDNPKVFKKLAEQSKRIRVEKA